MAATGPSDAAQAPDDRQDALDEWVEAFALILARDGLPRMAGRIFAHLLVADPAERSAAQLAVAIRASRGSISTMTRLLVGQGLLERRRPLGSRVDLYRVSPDAAAVLVEMTSVWFERLHQTAARGQPLVAGQSAAGQHRLSSLADASGSAARESRRLVEASRGRRSK